MHNITIKFNNCEIDVHYSIQPAEPDNGIQGPYIDEISLIIYRGVDVTDLLESCYDEIEDAIWSELEDEC